VQGAGHYRHESVKGAPGDDVTRDREAGTGGGEDGEIERGVDGCVMEGSEGCHVAIELAEHWAAGAHFPDACAAAEPSPYGAVIGGGYGYKTADAAIASEVLNVKTGYEAAHTECDQVELRVGWEGGSYIGVELASHDFE